MPSGGQLGAKDRRGQQGVSTIRAELAGWQAFGVVESRRSAEVCAWLYFAAMDLDVETTTRADSTVVILRGEIDVYTAPRLRQTLIDLISSDAVHLVVDMASVDFLDSTGLGVLVGGLKRVKAKEGSLKLVVNQDKLLKIFEITGLTKVFPIFGSLDEAVDAERA
jgi:anti-sigma B factor antagonist